MDACSVLMTADYTHQSFILSRLFNRGGFLINCLAMLKLVQDSFRPSADVRAKFLIQDRYDLPQLISTETRI